MAQLHGLEVRHSVVAFLLALLSDPTASGTVATPTQPSKYVM